MSFSANSVLVETRNTLLDPDGVFWTDDELYQYLMQGIRAACNLKPDLHVVTEAFTPSEGAKQQLPETALQLLDVVRNMESGRAVTQVSRMLLSNSRPNWFGMSQATDAKHFAADNDNVLVFWLYPPSNGDGELEIVYGAVPDEAEIVGTPHVVPLSANYSPALHAYTVSLALAKNTKRQDIGKSQFWMQEFTKLITGKTQTQLAVAPRATQPAQN